MGIAALIAWVITAGGGFVLLATWIRRGGLRREQSQPSRFPPTLILGHFLLAAVGLVIWIIYVVTDTDALAWTALVILLIVAALGLTMVTKWRRGRSAEPASTVPTGTRAPEQHFPVWVVYAHGLVAVVTLILVVLTTLGVGG